MSELTSEKIAKALKGAGLSSKQRIEKALEAWHSNAIFFPNKDDFLFDWICSAFAKPNLKKLDDCCLLQLPYWTLLNELLHHYDNKARINPKQSTPIIHVNLISSISTLLQQLYKDKSESRTQFLSIVHQCLDILFSDHFTLSYRPAFEHVSAGVDQLLISLTLQITLCLKDLQDKQELEAFHQLVLTAYSLLKRFDSQLVLAANQKKVFSFIVEKSFTKLLCVRRRVHLVENNKETEKVSEAITNIICHALFHADTVLEYTSVLKDTGSENHTSEGKVKQTNYVVRLFETLEAMTNSTDDVEQVLDAVDITPTLFSAFLGAFRQKRNTSTIAMQDISRMAEFGFFIHLNKILNTMKDKQVSAYLETLCQLLKNMLQWNVYSARNDDIAKFQQGVLNEIVNDLLHYLQDTDKYDQGRVLNLTDTLLKIDFSLIENCVQGLWPTLLNPADSAQASCLTFAKSILHTYAASRQVDVFVTDLINNVEQIKTDNVYKLLGKPMFARDFLQEFSSVVAKSMPVAQAISIFSELQDNLILRVAKSNEEPAHKKQKKNTPSPTNNALLLIALYMAEFTNALKLNRHQLRTFEAPVMSLFYDFVKPSIAAWLVSKDQIENTILPALHIHFTLTTAFFDTYTSKLENNDLEWLVNAYTHIFDKYSSTDNLASRMMTVITANTMLQHVYYASLLQQSSAKQTTELVNKVVDYVTDDVWYEEAQWSGSFLDLNTKNTVKLACWKLISDEWFDSVARFVDHNRAEKIASIIYMSLINDSNSTSISAQLLNKTLLRSANFYEAKCFKDCNIQTIFNTLVHLSKNELSTTGLTSHTAITMVSKLDTSKPLSIDHQTIEPLLAVLKSTEDLMDQDSDARSSDNIEKVASLMKLLLVFPIEYFEKNERPQAIYLATLIDIWGVQCTHADPVTRIKLSLMCRALQLRFIGYFSTHSILGLNAIALDWFVSSQQQWKSQEREALDSLERVTNKLDQHILRKMIMNAGSKTPDEHSLTYLQDTLRQRVVGLEKNDQKVTLTKLINLLSAINSVLANSKSSEVDLSNAVYAVNALSQISSYITCSLNKAKKIVSSILEQVTKANQSEAQIIADHEGTFEQIKLVFNLTRLVQEYARIVGPTVDEAIGIEKLSKTLTDLASPFIQFLQSALQFNKSAVLHMTTEFIAAFCSILTRYQQIDSTKRVLAAVWFVYSLVFKTGDQESIDILSKAFTSWVQSLSKEQYNIVFESFLEQAEDEANHRVDSSKEQRTLVLLSLFSLLQSNCVDSEKNRLRKQIPVIMLKLSLIAGKTTSFRYLQEFLKLLVQLTSDQSYHFKDYDASLLLSCLLQVAHPTAPERFKGQMNAALANALFIDICSILSNLITHHKEQVVYMMPPFIALVQSMLHCFKSSHVSLVTGKKRKHIDESKLKMGRTISLFSDYAPLDDVSAQRFARVLTTIPQKQPTLSSASKSTQTLQRMVAKHTPSILIEYFTIQSNPNMSIVQPSIKSILTNALYDILDLCSEADRNYVLSCLDGSGKTLFKTFYTSWKENHKYTGQ